MAIEWRERTLGELTENLDSTRVPVKEADRHVGPYPYYGASGIVDHIDRYLFDGEYLIIAEDGENLRTRKTPVAFMARGRFWVNNHAHVVRGNREADTRFLMYSLAASDISGYLTGSTMPKLTQGNLNRIPILTPPLREQRAIAHTLGTLDDKINLNRRIEETLEAITQALFKSWFVDFNPVRAKAQSRDIGLPKSIADHLPSRVVDSEVGEIPEGWTTGEFGQVVDHLRETVTPEFEPDAEFLHFSLPAYDDGQQPRIETGDKIKSNKWRVSSGAVLLSKLNPEIVRVWMVDFEEEERPVCSTEFLVLSPIPPVGRCYLYCLCKSSRFRKVLEGLVTGTSKSHQRAQVGAILRIEVVVPPISILEVFERTAAPMLDRVLACRRESATLAALRDTLLPKLISGELRVPDAERLVSEVV